MPVSAQAPIGSGFGFSSTADETAGDRDLSGKVYIVTGAGSGLGTETARVLAARGARIVAPVRSRDAAQAALAPLGDAVVLADMDLLDLSSVRRFAEDFLASGQRLDALVNNAGVMAAPLARTPNGWERQFAACHIGHFELSRQLLPALQRTQGARLVALSSSAHHISDVRWDDPNFTNDDYEKWIAYGQAKSANALFALGAQMRWNKDDIRAFSVHPGGIHTNLGRHLSDDDYVAMGMRNPDGTETDFVKKGFKNIPQGAATTVWTVLDERLHDEGGVYCEDCDFAVVKPDGERSLTGARARIGDQERADRLWDMTEALIAVG